MFTRNVSMCNFLLLGEGITRDDLAGCRQLSSKAPLHTTKYLGISSLALSDALRGGA